MEDDLHCEKTLKLSHPKNVSIDLHVVDVSVEKEPSIQFHRFSRDTFAEFSPSPQVYTNTHAGDSPSRISRRWFFVETPLTSSANEPGFPEGLEDRLVFLRQHVHRQIRPILCVKLIGYEFRMLVSTMPLLPVILRKIVEIQHNVKAVCYCEM